MAKTAKKIKRRYVSGYKRPSLAYTSPPERVQAQGREYLQWLATARGWFTEIETCGECHGQGSCLPSQGHMSSGQLSYWKKKRKAAGKMPYLTLEDRETCETCKGEGKVKIAPSKLDIERAESYVAAQRAELDRIADDAVIGIRQRLQAQGFRPVIWGLGKPLPSSLADYDAEIARIDEQNRTFENTQAAYTAQREFVEALWATGEVLYDDMPKVPSYYEAVVRHPGRSRAYTSNNRWYMPGGRETIHVGTRKVTHYRDEIEPTHSIVIKPGRAPSAGELDNLVAEACAAVENASLAVLPIAA